LEFHSHHRQTTSNSFRKNYKGDKEMKPQDNPLWQFFVNWANNNGVDPTGYEEDWLPYWQCFYAGATAYHMYYNNSKPQQEKL
jgi:hypothetical protein